MSATATATPTRSRRAVAAVAVLAAAAALVGILADDTDGVSWSAAEMVFDADAPAARVEGFGIADGESSVVVGYEHDTYASGRILLTNLGGSREVRSVRLVTGDLPLVEQVEDGVAGEVGPGEAYAADVVVRFDNCEYYHEREASLVHEVEVTSQVDGRTVVERVELVDPVFLRSPMLWQCPDRLIDRATRTRQDG